MAAAAAKSIQSCPTLCDPIDGSPPDSSIPGILQARTLVWVAISFFDACMCAVTSVVSDSVKPYGQQPSRFLCPWDSLGKNTGVGCHFLSDGIPVELFQILKDDTVKVLHSICSKFGKLSRGHRTGKGQFSFQSQRRAMPKNAQTTAQLH